MAPIAFHPKAMPSSRVPSSNYYKTIMELFRVKYHANFFNVAMGGVYNDWPSSVESALTDTGKLAVTYITFNWMLYGGIYIMNALTDLEDDKRLKPWRPLPSGAVSVGTARLLVVLLIGAGLLCGLQQGEGVFYLYLAFLIVNLLYSYVIRPYCSQYVASHLVAVTAPLRLWLGAECVGAPRPALSALLATWASMAALHLSRKRIEAKSRPTWQEHILTTATMIYATISTLLHQDGFGVGFAVYIYLQYFGFALFPVFIDDSYQRLRDFYLTT